MVLISGLIESCRHAHAPEAADLHFTGSAACRPCHETAYTEWINSTHAKAMQKADSNSVLANFDQTTYMANGVVSSFFRQDSTFWVRIKDVDGTIQVHQVVGCIGVFPLQQYMIEIPGGRMQILRTAWDCVRKVWFDLNPGVEIPVHDWLHYTGASATFNSMCMHCHTTGSKKNYNDVQQEFTSSYIDGFVGCEACHGAGSAHIARMRSDHQDDQVLERQNLGLPIDASNSAEMMQLSCAYCHARRVELSDPATLGNAAFSSFILVPATTDYFFADGQIKDEVFEYNAFLQSKMHAAGITCTNCHAPHSGKLLFTGNVLCLQCHPPELNQLKHTRHNAGSGGSKCISCHMPEHTFMEIDVRHDHSFRVPRPDLSVKYGTPNACNDCHRDRTYQWSADHINSWYGDDRRYHFSEHLIPLAQQDPDAQLHADALLKDKNTPPIIRAAVIAYLGGMPEVPDKWFADQLSLKDPWIRYAASTIFLMRNINAPKEAITQLLTDTLPALSMQGAALLLLAERNSGIQSPVDAEYREAIEMLMGFLHRQLDQPAGNLLMGDHYFRLNDNEQAIQYYNRALSLDAKTNTARYQLAVLFNRSGRDLVALETLQDAVHEIPEDGYAWYLKGLLEYEMQKGSQAFESFQQAAANGYDPETAYASMATILMRAQEFRKAESLLREQRKQFPSSATLLHLLILTLINQHREQESAELTRQLYLLAPNDPAYQQLYEHMHISMAR